MMLAARLQLECRAVRRAVRTFATQCQALVYEAHGPPKDVLQLQEHPVGDVGDHDVQLEMLAAPINPSDINQIEGKYPIKPNLPAVAGNEGVGIVRRVGSQVAGVSEGDWMVPLTAGQGTWRQFGTFTAENWYTVPNSVPKRLAATMSVNPVSAMRMLEEFVDLDTGDVVIQNGANSAVGRAVIQFAAAQGVKTVNVVRDRPDLQRLQDELQALGGTLVTTEERLRQDLAAERLPRPRLGLNCVGGSSSAAVAKALMPGATLVTYGGMSMKPVTLPTSLFIFKDLHARGFWLSRGDQSEHARAMKARALQRVVDLIQQNKYHAVVEEVPFEGFREALSGDSGQKKMLVF